MKYTILLAIAAIAFLASCQSTTDSKKLVNAIAATGNAYVQASPRISPQNKVYVSVAIQIASADKLDKATIFKFTKKTLSEQLKQRLSETELDAVMDVIEGIEQGKIDQQAVLNLANKAIADYLGSKGLSAEEIAAVTALAQIITAYAL